MQQFFLHLSSLSLLLYRMGYDLQDKASMCIWSLSHSCTVAYTTFSQGWSGNEDVQVVPSALFVCVLGQDKRIPYYRPAKHSLSLER